MSCLSLTQAELDESLPNETKKTDKTCYLVIKDCQYEILLGETKIGRNASMCRIILENETVSQVHAVIESEGPEDSFLYDNNSTNKTKIGKMVLKPYYRYKISNNDIITLGNICSKFIIINNNNCSSPTSASASRTSELGIKNIAEDNGVNKFSIEKNNCNSHENSKEIITEIFRTSSTFDFSSKNQKKSVNESSPTEDTFNQATQSVVNNSQEQMKQCLYFLNNPDISDEIFNATTQCEFPMDFNISNLSTRYIIQKSTETLNTEGLIKKTTSDSNVSNIFDPANKIQKFASCNEHETSDVDIFNCSTQFEIEVKDISSHKTSNVELNNYEGKMLNIPSNFNQILEKKLQFAKDSNNTEHKAKKEISKCDESKSVNEMNKLNNTSSNLNMFCVNEDKNACKLTEINSQVFEITDRQIYLAQQETKSKYVKLPKNIPDEIFDLPTQMTGQENEQKNSDLCAEKMETDFGVLKDKFIDKAESLCNTSIAMNSMVPKNEKMLTTELVDLKEDNVFSKEKEDTSIEKGNVSNQKVENEFFAHKKDEDDLKQIQSHCKSELFSEEQKFYAAQTVTDSNLSGQCSKVNVGNFESDKPGIEQQDCIKNELKLIDSSDEETESDLEIKIILGSSLKKENSQSQGYFISSGCDPSKDSNSNSLIPGNEDLKYRRSLSGSSDRTVSDLDVIELQNGVNLNLKIGDNEDFVGTNIFSLDNDSQKSDEKVPSDSDCYRITGRSVVMEQIKCDFQEKSVAVPPRQQQSSLNFTKSVVVNPDNENDSDAEKFDKVVGKISRYKNSEISMNEDLKKENDDNSNESESLIKEIEDSNNFYDKILISQSEEIISHFTKLPMKVDTNADHLTKSDSSPTLLSSHPVFDAFSEINDILSKKSSRENSFESETKINAGSQVFASEVSSKKLLLNSEEAKDLTSKRSMSDSDETDCEVIEDHIKERKWKDEDERARNASPASMIEQISFHEIIDNDDEIGFGQPNLQLTPTPEFKYEPEINFLSDPEICGNFHGELRESDNKGSVENLVESSKNRVKKPSCRITSYFSVSKPDRMKINESPLKRTQQMNSVDSTPKKKSKRNVRNVETDEVKSASKKVHRRKNCEPSLCAPESNVKVRNNIASCKRENLNNTSSKQNNSAETSSARMRTMEKERNECRLLSEVDLGNICPEGDGFENSLKEEKEVKEKVKSNLRQRRINADYFSSGSGKRRRMRPGPSTEEMESDGLFTKIAFTGIESASYDNIIMKLGGEVVNDLKEGQVLVTDRARRTVKFLCAVARGIPVVSPKWLIASEKKLKLIDPWSFLLKDKKAEKTWDFDLKSSLDKAKKQKLLHGYSVFATESTKPPVPEILDIVACCGGIPLISLPDIWPEKSIVLTCNEDKTSWPPSKHRHVKVVHYQIILDGVLKQLIDFKAYKLR